MEILFYLANYNSTNRPRIFKNEDMLYTSHNLIRDYNSMSLNYTLNENMPNIVKLTFFHFLLFVVSLCGYSLTHSRYYRRLSITIAQILLFCFYCQLVDYINFPLK